MTAAEAMATHPGVTEWLMTSFNTNLSHSSDGLDTFEVELELTGPFVGGESERLQIGQEVEREQMDRIGELMNELDSFPSNQRFIFAPVAAVLVDDRLVIWDEVPA